MVITSKNMGIIVEHSNDNCSVKCPEHIKGYCSYARNEKNHGKPCRKKIFFNSKRKKNNGSQAPLRRRRICKRC